MQPSYWQRSALTIVTALIVLTVFQLVAFGGLRADDWLTSFAAIVIGVGGVSFLLRRRAR